MHHLQLKKYVIDTPIIIQDQEFFLIIELL